MDLRVLAEEVSRKFFSYFHQIAYSTSAEMHRRSILESVDWLQNLDNFPSVHLFSSRRSIQNHTLKLLERQEATLGVGLILEFGVYKGASLRFWGNNLNHQVYGFDSFEGLAETFGGIDSSTKFLRKGKKPRRIGRNSRLIVGRVENTLENFLKNHPVSGLNQGQSGLIQFCHFDMDVYEPTKYVLERIKSRLQPGSLLLFDEFMGNPNWRHSEYKALKETLEDTRYEWIAFGPNQALLRITN
jgi:hypothetical protein